MAATNTDDDNTADQQQTQDQPTTTATTTTDGDNDDNDTDSSNNDNVVGDGNPTKVTDPNPASTTTLTIANDEKQTISDMAAMDVMMKQSQEKSASRGCKNCETITLRINLAIEAVFSGLGYYIGSFPYISLFGVLLILILCMFGLSNLEFEDSIFNLWTPTDSPIWEENKFIDKYWSNGAGGQLIIESHSKTNNGRDNILTEKHLSEWYELHLNLRANLPTIEHHDHDTGKTVTFGLFYEDFYPVEDLVPDLDEKIVAGANVSHYASRVIPFCQPGASSPLEAQFQLPCAQLTIFDCFTEGGTFFPYDNYLQKSFFSKLAPANPYTYRDSFVGMDNETLGEIVGLSCPLFNGNRLPFNFLYGGDVRVDPSDDTSPVLSLSTWESVFILDSIYEIARKIKIGTQQCGYTDAYGILCPEITDIDLELATELFNDWQLLAIEYILEQIEIAALDDSKLLEITLWAPRTGPDLLKAASSADFILLFIAYFAMIIFASLTALNCSNLFLSKSEGSFFGVILVLMAVAGTMGLGGSFVKLSPNIVQVLPFIALGFGVDDMFVLLFAYKYRSNLSTKEMISETVRIAGSSVALTSIANCLAFAIATTMVLPDVARFAVFGVLVVLLNFIAVIFGFTAILSLISRRQKNGYKDWSFLCCFMDCCKYTGSLKYEQSDSIDNKNKFEPFFNLLIKTPIRIICIFIALILFIIGIIGIGQIQTGLPLEDIVPSDSYAADYLYYRSHYYFTYGNSLYTDADGANHIHIDWANKFEMWLSLVNDIHSISDLIYSGFDVHSFWAHGFQSYLIDEKEIAQFNGSYYLQDAFSLEEEHILKSSDCEQDRMYFCPSLRVEYQFNSELFSCLYANEDNLINKYCFSYLNSIIPEAVTASYTWASQLYIQSYDIHATTTSNVSGLYVKSSDDTTNVYYKYPHADGFIFQSQLNNCQLEDNCEWYLLDSGFNLIYIGDPTSTDTLHGVIPSQTGWFNPHTGRPALITQNYFDFIIYYFDFNRNLNDYIYWDVNQITTFTYYNTGYYEWLLIQKMMRSITAYQSVRMYDNTNNIECDAVLEASEICVAIRDELEFGYVNCGGIEDESSLDTNWWIGTCTNDDTFVITSTDNDVSNIIPSSACNCDLGGSNNMYINKPSSDDQSTTNSTNNDCFNPQETISIQCSGFQVCNSLSSCYEEFEEFAYLTHDDHPACNVTDIITFASIINTEISIIEASSDYLAECLFSYFNELSSCCRESIELLLLNDNEYYGCNDITEYTSTYGSYDSTFSICNLKDKCYYDEISGECENLCYNNVWADCNTIIAEYNCTNYTCINTYSVKDLSGCCSQSLILENDYKDCLIPSRGYYDYDTLSPTQYPALYDYSICSDIDISSVSVCGTIYDRTGTTYGIYNNDTQINCLYNNINLLSDGCCKNIVNEINTNSYSFTKECEIDARRYCNTDAVTAALSEECETLLLTAAYNGGMSIKCLDALGYCASTDDGWPLTGGNEYAQIGCPIGFSGGYQIRYCNYSSGLSQWDEYIDISNCTIMKCSQDIDIYGQYWRETEIGQVAVIQGGYPDSSSSGQYNYSQVSDGLKTKIYNDQNGKICDLFGFGNTYFARRKCELNPLTGYTTANWRSPLIECRSMSYVWSEYYYGSTCDLITEQLSGGYVTGANLIAVIPWSYLFGEDIIYIPNSYLIEMSQVYCESALTNCVSFTYDNYTTFTYFFDYCGDIITSTELETGVVPEYFYGYPYSGYPYSVFGLNLFASTLTTYISPLQPNQFTGEFCSASSYYNPDVLFVPSSDAWDYNGVPDALCFYNLIWLYYVDPLGGVLSHNSIEFTVPYSDINITNTEILTTKNSFNARRVYNEEIGVELILATRKRLIKWKNDHDIYVIPGGFIVAFYSQYIGVENYMITNLIYVTIAVIGVGLIFLLNPIAVLICCACNIMMICEVYGFSHYVGLKINGVLVLNIVIAIGLTMEFTAHMARSFVLTSIGNSSTMSISEGQIRMKKTLNEMFIPVTLGAITTIIGVAPISAAKFPYFKLYYFNLYIIIVIFGWLNGVIIQPILLSFYPPKSFNMNSIKQKQKSSAIASSSSSAIRNDNDNKHTQQPSIELGAVDIVFDDK